MSENREIPKGWTITNLQDVVDVLDNLRKPINFDEREKRISGKNESELYPYYGATGQVGWIDGYITDGEYVLVGEDGAPFLDFYKPKAYIIKGKTWVNNHAHILRFKEGLTTNAFILHFLNQFNYNGFVNGTTRLKLTKSSLAEIPFVLPPLPEQHRIVAKIEELFSSLGKGIENLKTAQQQLKVYRQAALKWAFEGKLTNKNVVEGKLPEEWKYLKLRDITEEKDGLRRGPFGSAIKKECFVPSGYKIYEQGNAINDDPYRGHYFINEEKYLELKNFKVIPNDLIVSCSGVTLGRISEIPNDAKPGIINQALLRIRLRHDLVNNKYFILYFRAAFFQKKIFAQSQGTAMPNLVGIKDFKEIELLVPSLREQNAIVAEIESRLSVCDKIEESIEQSLKQAETLRQSLLKKAFEGKLVPQDLNDEPAGALLERIRKERPETPASKAKTRSSK